MSEKEYPIRPYARLLTMLGEQLIKDERIALIELIKNAYDADAEWVRISFNDFNEDYSFTENSKIIIEDSGEGMSMDVITKHWLNPATPNKVYRKNSHEKTKKGRIIQGEKGIGRFALLKLGKYIKIVTRSQGDKYEHQMIYDFTEFDDEFLKVNGEEKETYLDELRIKIDSIEPKIIIKRKINNTNITRPDFGTYIEISQLKGSWNENKIKSVYQDITKLMPIFTETIENQKEIISDFDVKLFKNDDLISFQSDYILKLNNLIENRTLFKITDGFFNANELNYSFKLNNERYKISLFDPFIKGLTTYQRFKEDKIPLPENIMKERISKIGSFKFSFYIFDFASNASIKYKLDKKDKEIIKPHRIYLYRDGVRVYPYGDENDDWLRIDQSRGTISAGYFLSNDQVVGYISISQKGNPHLIDKTNREGLIEQGDTTEDFISIIQLFLAYIRQGPYKRYTSGKEQKIDKDSIKNNVAQQQLNLLKSELKDDQSKLSIINNFEKFYNTEKKYLVRRAEVTEELAGVGLSVESASHDILGIMEKVFINLDSLIQDLMNDTDIDRENLLQELQAIRGGISFIDTQLRDIQLLFTSSKQRRKNIRISEIIEKVERIYTRMLTKNKISFTCNTLGSPLFAKTTDAVLLQLLLNLFDNSIYWLQQVDIPDKKIEILLDGKNCEMIFSDNGPGINEEDKPYIFEPFYSGKGEEGRGLGLYIARQLLERNDYTIELADSTSQKILSGANFVINFLGN